MTDEWRQRAKAIPHRGLGLAAGLAATFALVALLVPGAPGASRAEAAPLTCAAEVQEAVGAHAGSLSIRVGAEVSCDAPATLRFLLPGGVIAVHETDAAGDFTGVAGDAYVCSGDGQQVALQATAGSEQWTALLPIQPSESAGPGAPPPGMECDVLLHPQLNFVRYDGALATPQEAFAGDRFTAVIPFGSDPSTDGSDQVVAVFELVRAEDSAGWEWHQWFPGAPAFVNSLDLMVPGHIYSVRTEAELAWVFPE